MTLDPSVFKFLEELKTNNNRDWFQENKSIFKEKELFVKSFFGEIYHGLNLTDNIEAYKIWRIYRDVRFTKDKTPYKTWFSGVFTRATQLARGSYYLHIEPGSTIVGGGFYAPEKSDLLRVRKEFEQSDTSIRQIIGNPLFKACFPNGLEGDGVKFAPKGFDKNHKAIDLIRKKQFYAVRRFTDNEVLKPGFDKEVINTFLALRPFFDYMSSVLTTDLNGTPLYNLD